MHVKCRLQKVAQLSPDLHVLKSQPSALTRQDWATLINDCCNHFIIHEHG